MSEATRSSVFDLAAQLRRHFGRPTDRVSFTHVPAALEPTRVLDLLRRSTLSGLVPSDGDLLNHPERPSPVIPVASNLSDLMEATVTASTWDEGSVVGGRASELEIRLRFRSAGAAVHAGYFLWASDDRPATMGRVLYDHQRAETGYEGDDRISFEPSPEQVADFIGIVRLMTAGD